MLLRGRVGSHDEFLVIAQIRERRPDLRAVHDELVALDATRGAQAAEIRAGVGLGETLAPDHSPRRIRGRWSAFCGRCRGIISVGPA
jgi:hypothetical protein